MVAGVDGHGEVGVEAAAFLGTVAHDGQSPALVVEPVVSLAPQLDAIVEADLVEEVLARLVASVVFVSVRLGVQGNQQIACLCLVAQVILCLSLDEIHLRSAEDAELAYARHGCCLLFELHVGIDLGGGVELGTVSVLCPCREVFLGGTCVDVVGVGVGVEEEITANVGIGNLVKQLLADG